MPKPTAPLWGVRGGAAEDAGKGKGKGSGDDEAGGDPHHHHHLEHGEDCNHADHDHHGHDHAAAATAPAAATGASPSSASSSSASSSTPPGMVCDGDVCYVPGAGGGAPVDATAAAAYTDKPHADYYSTQVQELVAKGHSAEDAEAALKQAKYDTAAAAALLANGGSGVPAAPAPPAASSPPPPLPPLTDTKQEEKEEEHVEVPPAYVDGVNALVAKGLGKADALELLIMAKGDLPTALEILDQDAMARDLDAAVEEMVKEGWDEDVARQALLAQREKTKGVPATKAAAAAAPAKKAAAPAAAAQQPKKPAEPPIKPAAHGDVVFEVTEADLQKLVIESPVPVLLDVYAEWCGPCKQLGPMLEEMAVKSGGMFRLAKVDSDKNRGISEMLNVQALPSVFAFRDGALVDNFVGMPQQATLQEFMMRLLMGTKRPAVDVLKDPHAKTEEDLARMGSKLAHLAGLAAFGAKRKEKLERAVDELIQATLALGNDGEEGHDPESAVAAIRTINAYLTNLMKHFTGEPKYRSVNTYKEAYQARLGAYPPAEEILEKVGFRPDGNGNLVLKHRNRAPIIAADQVIGRFLARLKKGGPAAAAAMAAGKGGGGGGSAAAPIFRSKSLRRPAPVPIVPKGTGSPPPPATATAAGSKPPTTSPPAAVKEGGMPKNKPQMVPRRALSALSIRLPDGSIYKTGLGASATLTAVFASIRAKSAVKGVGDVVPGGLKLVARVPALRTYVEGGVEKDKKLGDLGLGSGEVILALVLPKKEEVGGGGGGGGGGEKKKVVSAEALAKKAKERKEKPRRAGTHTLFSEVRVHPSTHPPIYLLIHVVIAHPNHPPNHSPTHLQGHLDEDVTEKGKGNRYYGGGSTYFEAAVDEKEEEVEEEEVVGKEEELEEEEEEEEEEERRPSSWRRYQVR